MTDAPLKLFNSLTRTLEVFEPVHPGEARVYSCGPTVYNYQHIGNMRAYVFADTLGRTLQWKGYKLTHVVNITDVGHLTSDADEGEDKMERMAAREGKSAWDIAAFYQADFEQDLARLNVQPKQHPRATEYVEAMIAWGKSIADKHCYELESGLYFDVSTVADYGRLARAVTEDGEGRIESVEGKRNAADFAIWRKTPAGETRQMEWDSPWGRGAPGWHLECSVMGEALLGFPFDIHTGGIDHREIHHPNEIAQNQAFCCTNGLDDPRNSGAKIWMHNNFLVERSGKMSKSSGEFLRLQLLIDKGYHPLAYRLMCLQAHYRSELEFSWEGLGAALTRLKRLVRAANKFALHYNDDHQNMALAESEGDRLEVARLRQVILDRLEPAARGAIAKLDEAMSDDLNTPEALTIVESFLTAKNADHLQKSAFLALADQLLGLNLNAMDVADFRIRPKAAPITEEHIEASMEFRKELRAQQNYAGADRVRDELAAQGVEVMDGDPLGWEWKL
jgi:cysteinyl-tRNA synthetase